MNKLNKIHFAVKITTSSSKTATSVGLIDGVFRYTTDGYIPTPNDTYEDGYDVEPGWNSDLMMAKGFGIMSSKIDIIGGGDYAFLQALNIDLINSTPSGTPLHSTFNEISGLSVLGAAMQAYIIIDGVWHPRWSGQVGAKKFSDNKFTFIGEDLKSNSTDTLKDVILGIIEAENDYELEGDVIYGNVLAHRINLDDVLFNNSHSIKLIRNGQDSGSDPSQVSDWRIFNGIGMNRTHSEIRSNLMPTQLVYVKDVNNPLDVEVGDIVVYEGNSKAVITGVGDLLNNGVESTILHVSWIEGDRDYTILFGDQENEYTGSVHDALNSVASVKQFSIYKLADDGGIALENASSSGVIKLLHNDLSYEFPYILNSNGNITLTHHNASNIVKPVDVMYYGSDVDLFGSDAGRDWDKYSNIHWTSIPIYNNFDKYDDWWETEYYKYQYFQAKFKTEDVKKLKDPELGLMIKGMYDDDGQAWESKDNIGESAQTWYYCNQPDYTHNIIPTYPSKLYHTTPNIDGLAAEQSQQYVIEPYELMEDLTYGPIPRATGNFKLPNLIDNQKTLTRDDLGLPARFSFLSKSMPVTNVPGYRNYEYLNEVYCTYDGLQAWGQDNGSDKYFINGTYSMNSTDDGAKVKVYEKGEYTYVMFMVSASKENVLLRMYAMADTPSDFNMSNDKRVMFKLNSVGLYNVYDITSEVNVSYNHDAHGTPYNIVELIKDVSQHTGDYALIDGTRDGWISGLQVKNQEQRYNIITKMCKQSFIGGYTNRFGVDTYKQIGYFDSPVYISDNIIIDKTLKSFTSSPSAKVYNEFDIKGDNINPVSIKSVVEDTFPPQGSDYSDYVDGVDDYDTAKALWEKARKAFIVTNVIHKAPTDRTNLLYAQDYVRDVTKSSTVQGIYGVYNLDSVHGDFYSVDFDVEPPEWVGIDTIITIVQGATSFKVRLTEANAYRTSFKYVDITDNSGISKPFNFDTVEATVEDTDETYKMAYLNKLLDWTSYPKLQVNLSLPITTEIVKYEILDSVQFTDPIITPNSGEYGKGWITSYKVNASTNRIDCQLTFEPAFYIIPPSVIIDCNWINEDASNTDWINEDQSNTDWINEHEC